MLQMVRNKKHVYLRDRDIEWLRKASEKNSSFHRVSNHKNAGTARVCHLIISPSFKSERGYRSPM